ncbi:WD40/YVTN/BNR-like repeat-containing protein [Marinobacter sp. SS21]|uniref:WD40/YVTN/BNR-like repeat-containing protein n=1 Tax=Marinobacter sp. SS21 TaxID=2979460 RepID=UPI00232ED006|nr:YCF48-related protein [Marinobacter sp. SS21]MDC0662694.1 YCF48-related protein [Marinobacter sp. SS21]
MTNNYSDKGSKGLHRSLKILLSIGLGAAASVQTAWAEYQDPLDLPAQAMASAPQSLLLDVTKAGDRLVTVGERGHILYSDDQGGNWQQAEVAVSTQLNAVFFVDEKEGWAVGEDAAIVHSNDAGRSWQKQFDARDAEFPGPLLDLYFRNANEGYAVGVFNKLYRTDDGGTTWTDWSDHAENLNEWHFFAMAATDADTLYISSEVGLLFRSVDGGESFEPLQTDHNGSFHGVLAKRAEGGNDWLILSGVGGKLFTSKDGGASLRELETHTEAGLASGTWLDDGTALVVGTDGLLLHVAADLNSVTKYQLENGLPLSAVAEPSQDHYVLVGLGGIQTLEQLPRR